MSIFLKQASGPSAMAFHPVKSPFFEQGTCESLGFESSLDLNEAPVIGIVSQKIYFSHPEDHRFDNYTSFIMGAYVNFVESAGAQVIPLVFDEPEQVTLDKLSKINGVLLPGGGGDYMDIGKLIHETIVSYNDNGTYYPEWGTCLGFERLAIFTASDPDNVLDHYGSQHESLSLDFRGKDPRASKMFCDASEETIELFQSKKQTYNNHQYSIHPEKFESDQGLRQFWEVTSVSRGEASGSVEFVASMESKDYPIMATQFHPEKPTQVWKAKGVDHSWESIQQNRHFADKLVKMARQNGNSFEDFEELQSLLVSNHPFFNTKEEEGIFVF
uniref:folate gamma-glutamyl hydrolase n=1 Tax=Strombidium rassoulzadegani TaxID=1082188 RepID=A0A7S3CJB2_9SPIT